MQARHPTTPILAESITAQLWNEDAKIVYLHCMIGSNDLWTKVVTLVRAAFMMPAANINVAFDMHTRHRSSRNVPSWIVWMGKSSYRPRITKKWIRSRTTTATTPRRVSICTRCGSDRDESGTGHSVAGVESGTDHSVAGVVAKYLTAYHVWHSSPTLSFISLQNPNHITHHADLVGPGQRQHREVRVTAVTWNRYEHCKSWPWTLSRKAWRSWCGRCYFSKVTTRGLGGCATRSCNAIMDVACTEGIAYDSL